MATGRYLLSGRMPRRFKDHQGMLGYRFREHYLDLEASYGPFASELVKQAAADAAQAFVTRLLAVREWEDALTARMNGAGRRPNVRQVAWLAKRQALEANTYMQAINRLEALAGKPKGGDLDLARHLAAPPVARP
jgi:hypothetical protein